MEKDNNNSKKYFEARKRVKKIKGFYIHLSIYIIINTISTFINIYYSNFERIPYSIFSNWFYWGIGIAFHAYAVFGKNLFLNSDWEKRKIQELMDEDDDVKF
jgi:hypothetical protein